MAEYRSCHNRNLTILLPFLLSLSSPPSKDLFFNTTGIRRWALNDVSGTNTPGCSAYRKEILKDSGWLSKNAVAPGGNGQESFNKTWGDNKPIK